MLSPCPLSDCINLEWRLCQLVFGAEPQFIRGPCQFNFPSSPLFSNVAILHSSLALLAQIAA